MHDKINNQDEKYFKTLIEKLSYNNVKTLYKILVQIKDKSELSEGNVIYRRTASNSVYLNFIRDKVLERSKSDVYFPPYVNPVSNAFSKLMKFKKAIENYLLLNPKQSGKTTSQPRVRLENDALFIKLKDGTEAVIDFEINNKGVSYMQLLFKFLYKQWAIQPSIPTEVEHIIWYLRRQGVEEELLDSPNFLQSTISNIRKKIRNKSLSNIVAIEFDKKKNAYSLKIK